MTFRVRFFTKNYIIYREFSKWLCAVRCFSSLLQPYAQPHTTWLKAFLLKNICYVYFDLAVISFYVTLSKCLSGCTYNVHKFYVVLITEISHVLFLNSPPLSECSVFGNPNM